MSQKNTEIMEGKRKQYKKFIDYYRNDEEFRKRHLEYLTTPVRCECGVIVQRGYLNHHKRTKKHINTIKKKSLKNENIIKMIIDVDINKILFYLNQLKKYAKNSKNEYEMKIIIDKIKKYINKININNNDKYNESSDDTDENELNSDDNIEKHIENEDSDQTNEIIKI